MESLTTGKLEHIVVLATVRGDSRIGGVKEIVKLLGSYGEGGDGSSWG